ncbi:hypothetical protein [Actinoplanes sp. M2I2]|uniref:hypothetical protein n=1 Tax=Actinoplanes sp. M2I2 TaxID=1734444 RepID=UPI00202268B2|nr:hypothetical protein [Actinoplanes sp. M2I2]
MDAGRKRELEAKVYAGERLTRADGEALYASDDLAWLGRLAHHRRTRLHGDRVTFPAEPPAGGDAPGGAATMTYGPHDEPGRRIDQVLRFRDVQDETGGFTSFVPLRDQADPEDRATVVAPAESLKVFAVSRLLLDNVPHVTCSWDAHTLSIAQLALNFGADDLDGSATAPGRDELLELIWDAGFQPVERDAGHQVVREHDRAPSLAGRRSEPQNVWA